MEAVKEKDPNTMTAAELKALLAEKEKEERAEQERKQAAYNRHKDEFIKLMIVQAVAANEQLSTFKKEVVTRGNELHDLMFEVFAKEPKELNKFSLINTDGTFKVEIDRAAKQNLDETAEVHIATIKQVFKDKFEIRNKTWFNILETILMKNGKGDYDERLVAKLRKYEEDINDPRFSEALDGLAKAYYVSDTATYARFYRKNEETNKWESINVQFSSL